EGRDEEAVAGFREAIRLAPKERSSYFGLHEALGRLSRYEAQLENLEQWRALDPRDGFAHDAAYTPCAHLGRFEQAKALLEQGRAVDPNNPRLLKHLFQARMNLGLKD